MIINTYEIRKYTISLKKDGKTFIEIFYAKYPYSENKIGKRPKMCELEIIDNIYNINDENFAPNYIHREIPKTIMDSNTQIAELK